MCGRQRNTLAPQQVYRAARTQRWPNQAQYAPSYNAAPGFGSPVVRMASDGAPEVYTMRWGLVPSFTKKVEQPDFWRMFNARSESVSEKPAFSRLVPSRRCLVLTSGFYEWQQEKGGAKQPYYIYLRPSTQQGPSGQPDQQPAAGDGGGGSGSSSSSEAGGRGGRSGEEGEGEEEEAMVMAGLWDVWEGPEGPLTTYTILTTDSSPRLAWLHDRMPVILRTEEQQQLWLSGDVKGLQRLFAPYNGVDLAWHPVTPQMGKTSFQGAECCKELKKRPAADFFKPRKALGGGGGAEAAAAKQEFKQEEAAEAAQQQQQQQQQAAAGAQAPEAVNAGEKPPAGTASPPAPAGSPASGQKRKAAGSGGSKGSSAKKGKREPPPGQPSIAKFFAKAG